MKRIFILAIAAVMSLTTVSANISYSGMSVEMTDKKPEKKKKSKAELKEVKFHVHMHCNNCVEKIKDNISYEKGVKGLDVSLAEQTVVVKYDPVKTSELVLKSAIESLGYEVHEKSDAGHHHDHK